MKIGILGAGISGLTLGFFLRKKWPEAEITILEKEEHPGGVLSAVSEGDYFFELPAFTHYTRQSHTLLTLIQELGLEHEVLAYSPPHLKRYIWLDEKMQLISFNPLRLFTSSLTRSLLQAVFLESIRPRLTNDESVYEFGLRRFGKKATEQLLEPLVSMSHGGNIRELSAWITLKDLKAMERDYGSCLRGLRLKRNSHSSCPIPKIGTSTLFTLQNGMVSLVQPLIERIQGEIKFGAHLNSISPEGEVKTAQGAFSFDCLFSTLSPKALSPLIDDEMAKELFAKVPTGGMIQVHLGYAKRVLKKEAQGYMVPSLEKEDVLGAVFSSEIFPEQNRREKQTRITYLLGGTLHPEYFSLSDEEILMRVYRAAYRHLKIDQKPDFVKVCRYQEKFISYPVGHEENMQRLQSRLKERYHKLTLTGPILGAFSLEEIVASSADKAFSES